MARIILIILSVFVILVPDRWHSENPVDPRGAARAQISALTIRSSFQRGLPSSNYRQGITIRVRRQINMNF